MRVCNKCGVEYPLIEFRNQFDLKTGKTYRNHTCRNCRRNMSYASYLKNQDYRREYTNVFARSSYRLNPLKQKVYRAGQKVKYKTEVMTYYGGGKAACVICGFDNIDALCLDHISDNGKEERKIKGNSGYQFYVKLRSRGFPPGYQTLCSNHNLIKQIEKYRKDRGY